MSGAMLRLNGDERFEWLFVGGGPRRPAIERFCTDNDIRNVCFMPYLSRDRVNDLLADASIGLVTQINESMGSLVPSKIYSLLAAGVPVVFIGPRSSTADQVVARYGCGWQVDCGDVEGLVHLLEMLAAHPERIQRAAASARSAFEQHYNTPIGVRRVASILGLNERAPA
jgi:glycosyltransferase involved in cell wall biosynthesis